MDRIPLEAMMNYRKPTYDELGTLMTQAKEFPMGRKVTVYIDFNFVLGDIFRWYEIESGELDVNRCVSNIISNTAYFKHFFKKAWDSEAEVFYLYNSKEIENHPDIREKLRIRRGLSEESEPRVKKFAKDVIEKVIPMVHLILKYIPCVYFIDSEEVIPEVIPYFIESLARSEEMYFVTGDETSYLPYLGFFRGNSSILHLNGKKTRIINANNISAEFKMNEILSSILGGSAYNSIDGVRGKRFKFWSKYLKKAKDAKILSPRCITSEFIEKIDELNESNISKVKILPEDIDVIKRNDDLFNFRRKSNGMSAYEQEIIKNCIIDLYDYTELEKLNNLYFKNFPLPLQLLFE